VDDFKDQWNLEMALAVLGSETVDGGLWAEAVKWLLLYGPPELHGVLAAASSASFAQCFPGVRVSGHGDSGQPYYALADLAEALGIPVAEAAQRLLELQSTLGAEFLVEADRVYKVN
jgi:hypothetical protein